MDRACDQRSEKTRNESGVGEMGGWLPRATMHAELEYLSSSSRRLQFEMIRIGTADTRRQARGREKAAQSL
jgi:ribosomal protein S4